jgi:O-antigen ligase
LLAGLIISGPVFLFYGLTSIEASGVSLPASGAYHWILYGDIATLNALLMVVALLFGKGTQFLRVFLVVSIMCALYASLLSQSRGAWLAIPVCAVFLLIYVFRTKKISKRSKGAIVAFFIIVPAIVSVSPHGSLFIDRIDQAVVEFKQFNDADKHGTSVGGRLALWHVAIDVWKENPVFGTGVGDFESEFVARQKKGIYRKAVVHSSTHNLYFHALAETGAVGFMAMIAALLVLPWLIFRRVSADREDVIRLSGQILILSFAIFGLTASWVLRAPLVAIYLAYLMAFASSIAVADTES